MDGELAPGCGQERTPRPLIASGTASPAAEPTGEDAFIGSMTVDPGDGTLHLGTGLGLFRLDAGGKRAQRIVGQLRTANGSGPVSSNLVLGSRRPMS